MQLDFIRYGPPAVCATVARTSPVARYLEGLAVACLEAARNPRLVGTLVGILRLAPRTIAELAKAGVITS
jgi:hypothetical protein